MNRTYEEKRYEISVPGFPRGAHFRLAFLSDLHNCAFDGVTERLEKAKPDAVICGGDIANCPKFPLLPSWDVALAFYAALAERYPVYAVPGNHEARWRDAEDAGLRASYEAYHEQLREIGVVLLENNIMQQDAQGVCLNIAGLDPDRRVYKVRTRGERAFPDGEIERLLGKKPKGFTILVSHTPNAAADYADWGADLVLSGHIHGGIVRLPKVGGIVGPGIQPLPPYTKGKYKIGPTTLIVGAGLGEHSIALRIGNPRHIVYVDLVSSDKD
ncbi:MAG: metallophosphoesterase [Lachnospiraceae bacterium]|nr:metallophosphoesterase [Lachnospiraceae bacterium]